MGLIDSITTAYQHVERELRKFLKPYGVSLQQFNVLKILRGAKEPISTSVIRERMVQPMADSSRLVDRLSAKGWVTRISCSTDKRLVDVTISEEGIQFLDKIPSVESILQNLFKQISQVEAETLNLLLNKLRG